MGSAKKKSEELSYMQTALPTGGRSKRSVRIQWGGLDRRYTTDTGELAREQNISTAEIPYLVPSQKRAAYKSGYLHPIDLFGFDDFLLCIYRTEQNVKIDYIKADGTVYSGFIKESGVSADDDYPRCVVQFNVYNSSQDVLGGEYDKKLLIFPDKLSMDFVINGDNTDERGVFTLSRITNMPDLKYACVHLSRLFGVDDGRIYASGFNDYSNWNLDTADESLANNAWCSPAQSNTRANSEFTGITTFANHVVAFKKSYMHELYNNKNPFRIQDIFAEGALSNKSICDTDGRLIFVSKDNVKIYTGSNPREIGNNLALDGLETAVGGSDGRFYYLYCKSLDNEVHIFVYDTLNSMWAEQECHSEVLSFAHTSGGMYMLCADGRIYKMDTGLYSHAWSFETDLCTGHSIDIKHIDKVQIMCDMASDSVLRVYALYGDEVFDERRSQLLCERKGAGRRCVRIRPRMTAEYGYRLRFEGFGYVKIYQMEIETSEGGELFV